MHAQRHMDVYGTTQDQLGAIALAARAWAAKNPRAQMRDPLTLAQYHASPWVVEPFHVLDCCLVSNGAICVIVTSGERARALAKPPVYLRGVGQAHQLEWHDDRPSLAQRSSATAFAMAGCRAADIAQCQIYDCYTFTVLTTLEDYGFCKRGEGGPFTEGGRIEIGGTLPVLTSGGGLSEAYVHGFNLLLEGVRQIRGTSVNQVPECAATLVTGASGVATSAVVLREQ